MTVIGVLIVLLSAAYFIGGVVALAAGRVRWMGLPNRLSGGVAIPSSVIAFFVGLFMFASGLPSPSVASNPVLKEQVETQIRTVEKEINDLENSLKAASDFQVERARFYWYKGSLLEEPAIELTVKNDTTYPIATVYFHGVLSSPGRAVAWVDDEFGYSIAGGLEPGETATWKLSAGLFGDWTKAPKDRDDMILQATPIRLEGPNEKVIYEATFRQGD